MSSDFTGNMPATGTIQPALYKEAPTVTIGHVAFSQWVVNKNKKNYFGNEPCINPRRVQHVGRERQNKKKKHSYNCDSFICYIPYC